MNFNNKVLKYKILSGLFFGGGAILFWFVCEETPITKISFIVIFVSSFLMSIGIQCATNVNIVIKDKFISETFNKKFPKIFIYVQMFMLFLFLFATL